MIVPPAADLLLGQRAGLGCSVRRVLFLELHTLLRMEQRGITRDEIREALSTPEVIYESEDDPGRTVILGRTLAGRGLKIVVATRDHEHVITVAARDEEG